MTLVLGLAGSMLLASISPAAQPGGISEARPAALLARPDAELGKRVIVAGTLRAPGVSDWSVEWEGSEIAVAPSPEIEEAFREWSRFAVGVEVQLEGRLRRENGKARVDFWIYQFPKEFEEQIVDVPLVTVMDLMTDAETYSGRLVRVRGVRIKGRGHLPGDSRRSEEDWVLRDDCCDLWVTSSPGQPLPQASGKRKDERLDVVGTAETAAGVVHLAAENVVPAPPEMPAQVKLQVTGEAGEGFAPVCGKALVRVTILGDVPQVPLAWTLFVAGEKRSSGAVPFLHEGVLEREHELIEHVLFEHFRGAFMNDRNAHRDRLSLGAAGNARGEEGEARRLVYELVLSERDSGRIVASDETRTMVDCFPPLCSPSRGCAR